VIGKIDSIETFPVSLPLRKPVQMAHVTIAASNNVLVKITTDQGIVGWGEGVEALDITGDNQAKIKGALDHLGQRILGKPAGDRNRIWSELRAGVEGNTTAIGAIDIALHDIAGKALGVPVFDLIGGTERSRIPALTLMGSGDTEADLETFESRYADGFRWFKLKLGIGHPDVEATTLQRMAEAHPDTVLSGDANASWSEQTANRFLAGLDPNGVRFIEQPTRSRHSLLRLAQTSPVAICADESAKTFDDILGFGGTAVAGVSLKLIKHVGITGVMRGAVLCDALGLHVNLAGKIAESSIAAAANIHCAAAIGEVFFGASPANQFLATDVCENPPLPDDGHFPIPQGPGLGIDVDEAKVRSLAS
jgi:muconate cycloisomerase